MTGRSAPTGSPRYRHQDLHQWVVDVLSRLGVEQADARDAATMLLDADLAGVDTHGLANFATHDHYVPGLRRGTVAARPAVTVVRDGPAAATWDAAGGFGPIVARRAMDAAIGKAEVSGIGMVAVRDARHFGAHGHPAELAATRGLVGLVVANTPGAAFPPGGDRRVVGTSPLGFAAPVGGGPPLVVDLAMTAASGARVSAARQRGDTVPRGWVVDSGGQPSTDPNANRRGGALELLGGATARHKGFALAMFVETLALLAGGGPGAAQAWAPGPADEATTERASTWSQGQFFAALRIDLFLDPGQFLGDMRELADLVHGAARPGEQARLPGERRAECRAERVALGIPLAEATTSGLVALGGELGLPFPPAADHEGLCGP